MKRKFFLIISVVAVSVLSVDGVFAQALKAVDISVNDKKGLFVRNFNGFQQPGYDMPLVSIRLDDKLYSTLEGGKVNDNTVSLRGGLLVSPGEVTPLKSGGFRLQVRFANTTKDTIRLSNIVPFGESDKQVYLTSWDKGDRLTRAFIFRPGYTPVNVTLPDNAWGMGLGIVDVDNGSSVVAISRIDKMSSSGVGMRRFETVMYPGGELVCNIWMDSYIGRWQEGFRLMFQKNMLYDVEPGAFDNRMYEREDLKWVKDGFVGHFTFAWSTNFYNVDKAEHTYYPFAEQAKQLYGGDDYYIVWSGFPVLGLDQRNQWDLMRALPGGVEWLKEASDKGLEEGMRLMTNYKPWDLPASYDQLFNSTHYEDPVEGLGKISQEAGFKGVMFDTRSESGRWFQDGIDKYVEGFAIYPEGMCVPADMENCLIGRGHAAIQYVPMLNLNRLIKPDFKIYRQVIMDEVYPVRDVASSFFSGHGIEYHQYMPMSFDRTRAIYEFTGRTARIFRENLPNFDNYGWTPLLPTSTDSVWVNEWPKENKTIYTLYSLRPEGYKGYLYEVTPKEGWHFVDLWHNRELKPKRIGSKFLIEAELDPFPAEYLGTRSEAAVSAAAHFPQLISVVKKDNLLEINSKADGTLYVWQGTPVYGKSPVFTTTRKNVKVSEPILRKDGYNGDLVIQLFDGRDLMDQYTVEGTGQATAVHQQVFKPVTEDKNYQSGNMEVTLLCERDSLYVRSPKPLEFEIYPEEMVSRPRIVRSGRSVSLKLLDEIGTYEGNIIIVAKENGREIDRAVVGIPYGSPRLYSAPEKTASASSAPEGMAEIPAGDFRFEAEHIGNWGTKYPLEDTAKVHRMEPFYMDKHPVTNVQFKVFLEQSGYVPDVPDNFLKHWENGKIPEGEENYPVVFVSYEDAKAYAVWAGKRLPTEKEWQWAAQGDKGWLYPWGDEPDPDKCNMGNGIPDPVGKYPSGANMFGLEELTGSVWQLTNDYYKTATVNYIILKGGSYFTTRSSWWYVTGGALPVINRQLLLRVSQGYDRCGTVGFRLVKDK